MENLFDGGKRKRSRKTKKSKHSGGKKKHSVKRSKRRSRK
jgi:hypothetical protein